jgi:O-antigen ligase
VTSVREGDVRAALAPQKSETASWYAQALLVAALAWGAFAFGAVYPWAYWPLAGVAGFVGLAALIFGRHASLAALDLGTLVASFAVLVCAASLQLVSLSADLVRSISPETIRLVSSYDLRFAAGNIDRYTLSVSPDRTRVGLALLSAFALLAIGSARLLSRRGARGLAEAITATGVALALTGIVQQPLFAGKIYGFWAPKELGSVFGPFVNKNHFAGWMLMGLPVTLGLLFGNIARGMRGVKPNWRDRLVWFSSEEASRLVLVAAAAVVMALSLVMTLSRSGISALALAIVMTGIAVIRGQRTSGRRAVGLAYLVLLVVVVVGWIGADVIVSRFSQADWSEFNDRRGAWADAIGIASRFPLTGTGLNTYGIDTLFYQQHDLVRHYVQTHNDYLQLAAEGGALLVVPALGCMVAFAAAVRRRFTEETSRRAYWLRVGAVTGLAAIALQETVDFSLQMPGNAALFAVLCGIALPRAPAARPR